VKLLTSILLLALGATHAFADFSRGANYSSDATQSRFDERKRYLDALQLIRSSQFTRLKAVKPTLRTYPLYPYLIYTEMSYRISRQTVSDIDEFEREHGDTPLVKPLIQHWMRSLAKRGGWQIFADNYHRATPAKDLACHHAYALYKTGQQTKAFDAAIDLWTVGFSQPDECDPIFNVWRGQKGMTPEIAWSRFSLSLKANEKKLSSYLVRFLSKSDKPFASNYRLVHLKPITITRFGTFADQHPRNREIILHGVRRLARTDPERAIATLRQYEVQHQFDAAALEETYADLAMQLVVRTDLSELADTLPINLNNHPALIEARIRQSLSLANWSDVIVLINRLPEELKDTARWQYWRARVLALSTEAADLAIAKSVFTALAKERTFYGFLSADILDLEYSFEELETPVTQEQILALEQSPGIERALELFALGERSSARSEWYFSTRQFSTTEQAIAARVALRWGWYKASIQTMITAGAWDELNARFPLAFQDNFIDHARSADIPVTWSLAVARQESAFMPDAKSSAGALGVMQLMPSTAQQVARKTGVSYANNRALTKPDLNIKLGSHYLGQMLRRFDNNRILASAAYNAGPGRVRQWLNPDVPFDVWIEIIPFKETRGYVQNVLMFSNIYSRKLNDEQPLLYPHERDAFSPVQFTFLPNVDNETTSSPTRAPISTPGKS
jgi:soluble lytic murein transglycosylase